MDVISMARELGRQLQKDERYLNLMAASAANDASADLQQKIAEFSSLRDRINQELMNPQKNQETINELDRQMRTVYTAVMETPEMIAYSYAKKEMESLLAFLSQIITGSANGLDPDTIEPSEGGCSGSCESCGGCC